MVALGIIGAIAALSIPSLLNSINNRLLTTKLKNFVTSVQQLANEQMVSHKTRNLRNTDFASSTQLLSSNNFDIAMFCKGTDKYKCIEKQYRQLHDMKPMGVNATSYNPVLLKNGVAFTYTVYSSTYTPKYSDDDAIMGWFEVDVNGKDAPNVIGRDYFSFGITIKGKIVDSTTNTPVDLETKISKCKNHNGIACFGAIVDSGWKMPY